MVKKIKNQTISKIKQDLKQNTKVAPTLRQLKNKIAKPKVKQ